MRKFREHFVRIQSRGGDQALRRALASERFVTSNDHQMNEQSRKDLLAALDLIDAELLPTPSIRGRNIDSR